jgi:hypothetical protein
MRIVELFESDGQKTLVIFPGGFHIWTPGHSAVWVYLKKRFPNAILYAASSNKTTDRPFSFKDKKFLAMQAGIPQDRFLEVRSPYQPVEITNQYDPKTTVAIFGLSSKDKDRLGKPIKKDGTPSYFQPYPTTATPLETLDKHAYYVIAPSVTYKILGKTIASASTIRAMYADGSEADRYAIVQDLYPRSNQPGKIKKILDNVLLSKR